MTGEVLAVSVSRERGVSKVNVPVARLVEDLGIEGDAHARGGDRQVSLLADESAATIRERGVEAPPGAFAENITTRGVDLSALSPGDRVRVGPALLLVTRIGKECHDRCHIFEAVGDCVMPREGVFARVLRGGEVRPGDRVAVERATSPP